MHSLRIIRSKNANEMMSLCWISGDGATGFITDKLEDALIAEHIAETTDTSKLIITPSTSLLHTVDTH